MRRMKYQGNDKASGSRTHDKDELQVLCYNCRKPGHFKAECPYPIVKKHQDEHNYKKNSGRYHHPKSNPNDADEDSSSESDSSEDEKGLLCLFSQEDSDEEMCLMAEEEEVTSQDQYSNYSSESVCHENPREAFEKMLKSFYGIEDSHLKLKEENAKLLAERQDLEDLKSKNAEMLESISQLERQRQFRSHIRPMLPTCTRHLATENDGYPWLVRNTGKSNNAGRRHDLKLEGFQTATPLCVH
nr:uncharacterized protein LOC109169386 [Ipomoea trifida]